MNLTFETMSELTPGPRLSRNIERFWPAYRRWLLAGGGAHAATPADAERALRRHMPELIPTYERLKDLGPDDPLFARFLTLFRPPAFIGACSMAVIPGGDGPVLARNYDFDPVLAEGVILESAWRGRRVLGMADCIWGLVDGVNEEGLAVALTFGGQKETGDGFGIPLILRYVLETCRDVGDGIEALRAVPSHMAYNIGLADRSGRHAIVHLTPGGGATVPRGKVATNHQGRIHWPAHARFSETVERADHLRKLLRRKGHGTGLADDFLKAPLYRTQYGAGFGTLYSAVLDPSAGQAAYRWPGKSLHCAIGDLADDILRIRYLEGQGARLEASPASASALPEHEAGQGTEAFALVLSSIVGSLERAGRPLDLATVERLKADGPVAWASLGELFVPRP
jgi:predicted choloylglycine hydrolase